MGPRILLYCTVVRYDRGEDLPAAGDEERSGRGPGVGRAGHRRGQLYPRGAQAGPHLYCCCCCRTDSTVVLLFLMFRLVKIRPEGYYGYYSVLLFRIRLQNYEEKNVNFCSKSSARINLA